MFRLFITCLLCVFFVRCSVKRDICFDVSKKILSVNDRKISGLQIEVFNLDSLKAINHYGLIPFNSNPEVVYSDRNKFYLAISDKKFSELQKLDFYSNKLKRLDDSLQKRYPLIKLPVKINFNDTSRFLVEKTIEINEDGYDFSGNYSLQQLIVKNKYYRIIFQSNKREDELWVEFKTNEKNDVIYWKTVNMCVGRIIPPRKL